MGKNLRIYSHIVCEIYLFISKKNLFLFFFKNGYCSNRVYVPTYGFLAVTTTENGLKALEYLGLGDNNQSSTVNNDVSKVNMIITDYCMPGMTGYELLKKIKESSVMKDVPVVIMSSESIPTRINKCLEKGAQMFMLKPLKYSDVKKLRCQLLQSSVRTSSSY